jgi:iron complex outermembrane receptor protein
MFGAARRSIPPRAAGTPLRIVPKILTVALTFTVAAGPRRIEAAPNDGGNALLAATDPLEEILVLGHYKFLSADTTGLTDLPVSIDKVPQSISLVDSDFIKAADLKTLAEVAEYTPGALNAGNHDGFETTLELRGFPAAYALDGINFNVVAGANYALDFAVMDRLEVIKGPTSVVYGESSAGGLINFVTKSAAKATPSYLSVQIGSWNSWRVEGQIAAPLDTSGRIRGIGIVVRDQGNDFVDQISHEKTVAYGGVNFNFTEAVTAYLHGGYEGFVRTSFDGIPTEADGSPAPLPLSYFIGSPSMKIRTAAYHAEGDIKWHATDMLDLSFKSNYIKGTATGFGPYSCCLDAQGNIQLALNDYQQVNGWDYGVGVAATYHLDQFGLNNSFVSLAALYQYDRFFAVDGNPTFLGQPTALANVFAGEAAVTAVIDSALSLGPPSVFDQIVTTVTLSAQSMIEVVDHWTVLLAAARTHPGITNIINGTIQGDDHLNGDTTYRSGLIYEFAKDANAYLSFSQSFNPQLLYDIRGRLLQPLRATQYEGGIKYRLGQDTLLLSGAIFDIRQKNQGQFVGFLDGVYRFKAIGQLSHRGAEIAALGHISPQWQINAGFSFLHTNIDIDSDPTSVGRPELFLPTKTGSVFTTYSFSGLSPKGLSIGAGFRYVGAERTAYDGSSHDIPSYGLIDASLTYARTGWTVQLNAHNLLDKYYFINTYGSVLYGNVIGAPTNWDLSIRRQF